MNIISALHSVVDDIIRGNEVRVKNEYATEILDLLNKHPEYKVNNIEKRQDKKYTYIKAEMSNATLNPYYATPEVLAEAIHTCDGKKVVSDDGIATGYNLKCQVIHDVSSKLCLAYKIEYIDATKNKYFIAGNKEANGLLDPTIMTDQGRTCWIECQKKHFDAYLNVLRTRIRGHLRTIRDDLRLN